MKHLPNRKVKFTIPPHPWINDLKTVQAKNNIEQLQIIYFGTDDNLHGSYQQLKITIEEQKIILYKQVN